MKKIEILLIDTENPYISIGLDINTAYVVRGIFIEKAKESINTRCYNDAQDYIVAVNDLEKKIKELRELETSQEDK